MLIWFYNLGAITTNAPLDRETKAVHELVLEARDQGTPSRAARVSLKVTVLDVNDNAPEIIDPQSDVVSVREEQPLGTEVARVKALDVDLGENASVTYTILEGITLNANYRKLTSHIQPSIQNTPRKRDCKEYNMNRNFYDHVVTKTVVCNTETKSFTLCFTLLSSK